MPATTRARATSSARLVTHPYARLDVAAEVASPRMMHAMNDTPTSTASSLVQQLEGGINRSASNLDEEDLDNVVEPTFVLDVSSIHNPPTNTASSLVQQLEEGINRSASNLDEEDLDNGVEPTFVLDVSSMNNPLMLVHNANGIVLHRITVERSMRCCENWREHMNRNDCDDIDWNYAIFQVEIQARDALHVRDESLRASHSEHVRTGNSGARVSAEGHLLTDALNQALQSFRMLSACGGCGNLFVRTKELAPDATCPSCVLQAILTPDLHADCTICLESTTRFVTLPCSHRFHAQCFLKLPNEFCFQTRTSGRKCPNCRKLCQSLPIVGQ